MKLLYLTLLIVGLAKAASDLAYTAAGAEKLSNVFSIAENADKQFAVSNYIDSLKLYAAAELELGGLMEASVVDPIKCRKILREYNKKKASCEPLAAKQAYFKLRDVYLADRLNFYLSLSNENIRTMNILLNKVNKSYKNLLTIYSTDAMPKNLPLLPPPTKIQKLYSDFIFNFRTNWIKKFNLSDNQLYAFYQIAGSTSISHHIFWLETAAAGKNKEISLSWLQKIYENLAEQEPCNRGFWYGLGNSYLLQNKEKAANLTWHKALKFFPDSIYFHYHLAKTCGTQKNEIMRAVSHLKWILKNTKDNLWRAKTHYLLAKNFVGLSDIQTALAEINDAAALAIMFIDSNGALYSKIKKLQGQILLRLDKKNEALAALKSAADASPDDISYKLEVADLLTSLANDNNIVNKSYADEALFWYDRILRQQPKQPTVHGSKAFIYLLLGDINRAQGEAIQELAIKPDSSATLATLGYTYLAQKDYETAKLMFKKALDFDAECSAALEGIKKIPNR